MRNLRCILFLISLTPPLVGSRANAAAPGMPPSSPLGIVVSAENSRVGADTNYAGATVYDGDRFATQDNGTMRLRLGNGQLLLFHATAVVVHAVPLGFLVNLDSGIALAASSEGHTFELIVNGISIRSADAHRAVAQVERVNSAEAILVVGQGNFKIAMGDEVRTVAAGNSYKLEITGSEESSSSGEQAPQGAVPTGRNRNRLLIIVITAVAATTGILIWRATMSPTAP
jgi:hypothetical protein